MAIVEVRDVEKTFLLGQIEVRALRGLSLDIEPGEFTAIVGPSGSGKSTLLNLIGALDMPSTGTVTLDGHELTAMSAPQLSALRRDRIGFVFQSYNLIPVLSAYENAEAVLTLQGVGEAERRARVMPLLAELGLEGMEDRRPGELSGGQQQRVAIARAIASDPAVVLADEPTANLDSETTERLIAVMERMNRDHGVTFLFSTHDPRVVNHARRVVTLVDGRVAEDEQRG